MRGWPLTEVPQAQQVFVTATDANDVSFDMNASLVTPYRKTRATPHVAPASTHTAATRATSCPEETNWQADVTVSSWPRGRKAPTRRPAPDARGKPALSVIG